jgi:hypothetical protein
MTCRLTVLAVVCALVAAPAAAQRQGSVEVGGFLGYANYDNTLPLGNTLAFGGRVGVHVLPVLAVEATMSRASHNGADHSALHVFLAYNVPPVSRAEIVVGGGYVKNSYSGSYDADDSGIAGFVSIRHRLRDMLALRLDAVSDFIPSPANKSHMSTFNGNWGVQAGVSVLLNRGRSGAAPAPTR